MRNLITIIILSVLLSACTGRKDPDQPLYGQWKFAQNGKSETYPASVPGCVHTDLLANGRIEDPFYGDNESNQQWIGEKEWVYSMTFIPDEHDYNKDNIELVFEGLDTYAEVYLNDSLILFADNMFRSWEVDVKEILLKNENYLKVIFLPPGEFNDLKAGELPCELPDKRAFTRKAPYQFGWDWGPEFVTCGIWKPVSLLAWNDFIIESMHVGHASIDLRPLPLYIHLDITAEKAQEVNVILYDEHDQELTAERVSLGKGRNTVKLDASLDEPELWWPVGLGSQHLYQIKSKIIGSNKTAEKIAVFGVRDLELVREADSFGESFHFKVNGLPVFMKGANYIPQDNFLTRVDSGKYEKLITSVLDANINMLRVWGGGIYENDIFYDLCDINGILVWQDFMFACNMYPGDEAFLDNVEQEAVDNVVRLSNHPSIALWCGNNEIDEGWYNWGWQKSLGYTEEDSSRIWNDYLSVFHNILPDVVEEYDPGTIYWPSSPMTGWGRDEAYTKGDVHYWGVWWGEEPFEMYRKKIGRFVSEYGFQGMPPMKTIESFGGFSNQKAVTSILESHQKHPRGTELIQKYMEREFIVPEKFEDYVYISQVLQAEGMAQGFVTHRLSQPHCMGTLYWQLNDCWPVTSWSGLDYYGNWKALHYHVKRAYQPVMVGIKKNRGFNEIIVVNDHPYDIEINLVRERYSMSNRIGQPISDIRVIPALSAKTVGKFPDPNEKRSEMMHLVELKTNNDSVVSRSFHYFVPTKDLKLDDPALSWEVDGQKITIRSEKLARQVFLEAEGIEGRFSDNFFDMAPGEERVVWFIAEGDSMDFSEKLTIKSIFDTYQVK